MIRSFDQLRRGSDELFKGLENFNRTMQNLNDTAERVNALLNEFEEPVRAVLPQVLATARLAEDLATRVSGPIDQLVPGLTRLADTLSSPVFTSLPTDLSGFVDAINDLVRRLAPLGQIAESAGGLFGLRIPGVSRRSATPPPMLESVHRTGAEGRAGEEGGAEEDGAEEVDCEEVGEQAAPRKATARRPRHARRGDVAQRLTKGVATTEAGSSVPRTSIRPSAPTSIVGGTNPRAMPWPSVGEKLPDVTAPTTAPSTRIGHPARGGRRPSTAMPDETTGDSPGLLGGERGAAAESPLFQATTQPSPACSGVMPGTELVAVQRQAGFEPQRVAGAEPGGLRRRRPTSASHSAGAAPAGTAISTPVLARVAGAGDGARRRRPTPTWPTRNRPTAAASGQTVASRSLAPRALDGEHGALVGRLHARRRRRRTRSVFDALGITSNRGSPSSSGCHHTMMSSSTEASSASSRCVYWARPGADLAEVVGQLPLQRVERVGAFDRGPCRGATRRTRRRRRGRRGARRSCPVGYSSGISQPPNGTMRAPSARWTASSGERSSGHTACVVADCRASDVVARQ